MQSAIIRRLYPPSTPPTGFYLDVNIGCYFDMKMHGCLDLLCVSCPGAIEFSAIFFLLLARSSSNSPRSLEAFRRTLVLNFIQIRRRVKTFPIDLPAFGNVITLPKAANIYNGVYGEIIHLLSDPVEISPQSLSKTLK